MRRTRTDPAPRCVSAPAEARGVLQERRRCARSCRARASGDEAQRASVRRRRGGAPQPCPCYFQRAIALLSCERALSLKFIYLVMVLPGETARSGPSSGGSHSAFSGGIAGSSWYHAPRTTRCCCHGGLRFVCCLYPYAYLPVRSPCREAHRRTDGRSGVVAWYVPMSQLGRLPVDGVERAVGIRLLFYVFSLGS